jgi:molecular chaperone DnaK (HSP70)
MQAMEDANMKKSEIDEIVLVGGSTRIPKVQALLREYFDGACMCVVRHVLFCVYARTRVCGAACVVLGTLSAPTWAGRDKCIEM